MNKLQNNKYSIGIFEIVLKGEKNEEENENGNNIGTGNTGK